MRWIPKGMTVAYLKKAVGTQRATATPAIPPHASQDGYDLPFEVVDREGVELIRFPYIMSDGAVLAQGTPAEILANDAVREVYLGREFRM